MMFLFTGAFAIALIALAAGGAILYFLRLHPKIEAGFCHFIGWFVIILAFLSLLCSFIFGVMYSVDGYYKKPFHIKHEMKYKRFDWMDKKDKN